MLRIASFATSNGDQGEAASSNSNGVNVSLPESANSNGQNVSVPESANSNGHHDDEDSDSDIEMYEPPEPTVDRSLLRGDPKAEVKQENEVNGGDAGDAITGLNLGAVPGGGLDDLAATPEEEQRIEEQVRIQQQLYVPDPSANNERLQIIQGERRTYRCTLCQTELSSEPTKHSHQTGTKHLQKKFNHELEHPEDEDKIWIVQVANPPPAKRKIIIRVHEKIRESNDPIIGLEYITELLPETDSEQEPVYECLICGQKGGSNANGIFSHLMGQQHRQEVMKDRRVASGRVESQRCLKYARDYAENNENLEELIKTIRDDLKYPWPCDKAPWSKARGGSGVPPNREKKIKTEMKPSVNKNVTRGIIPNPGETKEIKCAEEAERYLNLAKQLLTLLGESSPVLSRVTAIKKKTVQKRNTSASHSFASNSGASHSGASHSGASHSGASHSGASNSGASYSGVSHSGASHSGASHSGASHSSNRDSQTERPGARGSDFEGYGSRRTRDNGFSNGQSGRGSWSNDRDRSPQSKRGRYEEEFRHHRSSRSISSSPGRGPRENESVGNKETARYEERRQASRSSHTSRSPSDYRSRRSGDRDEGKDYRSQNRGASYSGRNNRNSEDRDSRYYRSHHDDNRDSSRSSNHRRRSRSPPYSHRKRY